MAFADLADGSFVTGGAERTFTVPPQVLDAARSRIPDDQRWRWIERSLQLLRESDSLTTDRRTTPIFRLHVASVVAHAEGAGLHAETGVLRQFLGDSLEAEGRVEEAEALLRASVDRDETAGAGAQQIVWDLRALADLLQSTGRAAEAEPLLHKALTLAESWSFRSEPLFVATLLDLGVLLLDLGRPAEAQRRLRRAVILEEGRVDPVPSHLGASLRLLALAISKTATIEEEDRPESVDGEGLADEEDSEEMEPLDEAEQLAARALALAEAMDVPDDLEVAYCLGTQAAVLQAQGRWDEAEPLLARSSELLERLGDRAPERGRRWLERIRRKQKDRNAPGAS